MKKSLVKFGLLVLGVLSLSSCGISRDDTKFKVGMECAYAPWNWTQSDDSNGAVAISNLSGKYANGYDVQIAKKVAKSLGKTLEIYSYDWEALIPAVQAGTLDGIAAGMSPTEERKKAIDFSSNYYDSNLVVICNKDTEISTATCLADINKSTYKIEAQVGTFHLEALKAQASNCITKGNLKDFTELRVALEAKTIDGYVAEEPTAMAFCTGENPTFTYVHLVNNDTGFTTSEGDTAIAIGLKKGSALKESIDNYLNTLTSEDWNTIMSSMVSLQNGTNIEE